MVGPRHGPFSKMGSVFRQYIRPIVSSHSITFCPQFIGSFWSHFRQFRGPSPDFRYLIGQVRTTTLLQCVPRQLNISYRAASCSNVAHKWGIWREGLNAPTYGGFGIHFSLTQLFAIDLNLVQLGSFLSPAGIEFHILAAFSMKPLLVSFNW